MLFLREGVGEKERCFCCCYTGIVVVMAAIMRGTERIKQINEDARGFALTVTNCLRIIDNQNMDDGASGIKASRWYCFCSFC